MSIGLEPTKAKGKDEALEGASAPTIFEAMPIEDEALEE